MTVPKECEAEILRLVEAEKLAPGTAASTLMVHHDVVDRVLEQATTGRPERLPRPSKLDPYKDFMADTLDEYPKLGATRLRTMMCERGFDGSARIVQRHVLEIRPRRAARAYAVCERLPGEEGQIDWGHVGRIRVAGGHRALWVFVMLLAYSRARYAELVLDLTAESLRRSLLRAVSYFAGTPRRWLFDNAKTVVLERHGATARLHPGLVDLASALRVQPTLARVRTPTDKGGVERSIRDLKEGFFAGRKITCVETGNLQLRRYLETIVLERRHPTERERTVREVFAAERARLLPLPTSLPVADLVAPVAVDKTASVRLATNRYSVPPEYAERTLTLVANDERVRLLDGDREVASHARSSGRGQRIDDPAHRRALAKQPRVRAITMRDQMLSVVPELHVLYERWVDEGRNVNFMTGNARKLLGLYGQEIFGNAVRSMNARGTHDVGALSLLCEQERQRMQRQIPVDLQLGAHVRDRVVASHDLASYDKGGNKP